MTRQTPTERIHAVVLDSVLFGMAKALEYLDVEGQVMMDKIGAGILEYCFKAGYIEKSGDLQQLTTKLGDFFTDNNYVSSFEVRQEGELLAVTQWDWQYLGLMKKLRKQGTHLLACPLCLADNAVFRSNGLYLQEVSEELIPNGGCLRKFKIIPGTMVSPPETLMPPKPTDLESVTYDGSVGVGLPAFEAVGYGLAHGLEYLGAQADVLLENVGNGILEFLKAEAELNITGSITKDLDSLASIFRSRGLAVDIRASFTHSVVAASFNNYRYQPVLRLLLEEDVKLISCPFTLAAKALLRDAGWAIGKMKWTLLNDRNCTLTMQLLKVSDQQFDEEKIGAIMDKA